MAACFEVLRQIDNAIAQWEIIYKKNHAFRDVAAKLAKYKDIQTNDALKDYLTCGNEDFTAMCAKLTQNALSFAVQRSDAAKWGCQIIATERDGDWMSVGLCSGGKKDHRKIDLIDHMAHQSPQ